ncbi:hypothetical protein Bca4012_019432 [Brassica carinata]
MVPPSAPYSQYTVEDILAQPAEKVYGHRPDRPDGTLWYGLGLWMSRIDVTDTMKGYFSMPHPNWKKTPVYIRKTWFKIFAVIEGFLGVISGNKSEWESLLRNLRRQNPIQSESTSEAHNEADVERRSDEF